jgi:hypothetical protein
MYMHMMGQKLRGRKNFGLSCEKGLKCLVIFSLKVNKKSIMVHPIKLCKVSHTFATI